jgi:hypothetical protein
MIFIDIDMNNIYTFLGGRILKFIRSSVYLSTFRGRSMSVCVQSSTMEFIPGHPGADARGFSISVGYTLYVLWF